ncbi:MAG: universal stress protein [Phycisphaerae bacterium]|nr:universal stress protein [Phycisphaerae bacterium]
MSHKRVVHRRRSGTALADQPEQSTATAVRPEMPTVSDLNPKGWNRILVAVDPGPSARQALEVAVSMADRLHAQLAMVYVVDCAETQQAQLPRLTDTLLNKLAADGRQWCASLAGEMRAAQASQFVRIGDPAVEILAVAREWQAEIIVMGNHGLTHTGRFFLGNTVETVVRDASCPVMTVPPGVK